MPTNYQSGAFSMPDDQRASSKSGHVVYDATRREPEPGEVYAVVPRSEWRVALDY